MKSNRNKFLWQSSWASCFWLKRWLLQRRIITERHKQRNATNTKPFYFMYTVNPWIIHTHAWLGLPKKSICKKIFPAIDTSTAGAAPVFVLRQPSVRAQRPIEIIHKVSGWKEMNKSWSLRVRTHLNWGNLWAFTESCPTQDCTGWLQLLRIVFLFHNRTAAGLSRVEEKRLRAQGNESMYRLL